VVVFHPFRWFANFGRFFRYAARRNHRKALIIDGLIAFTGG